MAENHVIKYDSALKELNASFSKHISTIRDVVEEYKKLNTEFTKIPSEYIKRLERVSVLNERLEKSERQLTQAKKQSEQARKREVEDYQRRARAFDRAEKQAKRLEAQQRKEAERLKQVNNAYNQAQAALKRLSAEYNHLAMRKQQGEKLTKQELSDLKRLRKEVLSYQNALKSVDAQRGVFNRNVGNYKSALGGIGGLGGQLMGALGYAGAIYSVVELGKKAYQTTKELDTLHNSMYYGSASVADYQKNLQFLTKITEDYGLELLSTSMAFNKFYVASKDKLGLEDIQLIFDKVSKSASIMGLSVADQEGIFRALEQMMSKGTIQSEELRMQLGDRIPVAMQAMAKAVGVGERELMKMMKDGELMSAEILPKFAVELEKAMGADMVEKIETLAAAENKLSNAWTNLVQNIREDGNFIGEWAKDWSNGAATIIKWIDRLISSWDLLSKRASETGYSEGFSDISETLEGVTNEQAAKALFDRQNARIALMQREKELQEELNDIQDGSILGRAFKRSEHSVGKELEGVSKELGRINGEIAAYKRHIAELNGWSDKNEFSNPISPKDPKKSGKDPVLERIKAEYELQRAILQTASLEAQIAGNRDEYYTKEQELALLERNYKLAVAEREVKDKEVLTQRKLTIEEEYNQKIIKLNDTEGKEFEKKEDEKAKAHQKYLQKRLKMMQGVYEDMLKVVNDAYDKEMAILRLQEQGFDYQGLEYWENRRRQLDLMLENRKISLEEHNLEVENLGKEQKQIFRDYLGSFTDLGQFGFGSLNKFFDGTFEEIWAGAETLEEKFTASFLAMSEVAKDLYNVLSQSSQAYFENEYANLELQKEVAIKYAGESAEARERIEEQYQARKSELKRQEAQQEKQAAIFNAIINIATGVTAALSQEPPYSFILAALVGALGAVQISTIASTPLPQFWRGTDNAPEGWAIVDEKRPEVHTDKKGNIKSFGYSGGANLRFLEQGDKIYPSHEAFFNEMGMSAPINGVIEGYSAIDYERMEAIMDKTVGKITLQQNVIDEGGFKRYVVKGNSRTELKNKRILKS